MTSRAEFEQWWSSLDDETRLDNHKFSAWMGWQALRAAISVKLPKERGTNHGNRDVVCENMGFNDCLGEIKDQLGVDNV